MSPRISPGGRTELGPLGWLLVRGLGLAARTRPPNLFATLGKNPRLMWGWLMFAGRLMPFGSLARRETELVILRVAHRRCCPYELEHHKKLGARANRSADEIARVTSDDTSHAGFSERERALLRATDAILDTKDLPDALWAELSAHLDEARRIELVMLVAHYDMLATTIQVLRIAPDSAV